MKKAQIKMAETVAVVVIFLFIIFIGFIFYSSYEYNKLKETSAKYSSYDSISSAQMVSFLPELKCTFENKEISGCIDLLKLKGLIALENELGEDDFFLKYYDLFGNSLIRITELYPNNNTYVIYNYSQSLTSTYYTPMFITLKDELNNIDRLALLEIYYGVGD